MRGWESVIPPPELVYDHLTESHLARPDEPQLCYSIGVLFEPLMRPVFNVPGEGAFALSMGLAAGYPMDAVITARFRRQNMCTRIEGERMLAFTNTADPVLTSSSVVQNRGVWSYV